MARKKTTTPSTTPFADALRVSEGFTLADVDPRSTPAFSGGKQEGKDALLAADVELDDLQERLYAGATAGRRQRVLLVIQGMDTSGKGGIMRHVVGAVDPQGVELTAFKAPTEEERRHPFLWRIRRALPGPGMIGVFDRSHYEDVLIVRVHDLVPPAQWRRRYATINAFEQQLVDDGVTLVKVMMHISSDEQRSRLQERLDRRTSTGSTAPQTSTSGPSGATTRRHTRRCWSGAARRARPGSSCRPTGSGTPVSPSSSCSWSTCA